MLRVLVLVNMLLWSLLELSVSMTVSYLIIILMNTFNINYRRLSLPKYDMNFRYLITFVCSLFNSSETC